MLCGSNQLSEGFILSGEAMSKNNSTNHIWDGMNERERRIQGIFCNHNNKCHLNVSYSALVKWDNITGYLKNFQASIAFHRETATFLQNCSIPLIFHSYGAIP